MDKNRLDTLQLVANEYTQRNQREAQIDSNFKILNKEFLEVLGDRAWNWDMQVLLKRQVLSRIIHYYEIYKKFYLCLNPSVNLVFSGGQLWLP